MLNKISRLATTCCYDFVYTAPAMTVVEPGAVTGFLHGGKGADVAGARAALKQNVFDPSFQVPPDLVIALLSSRDINWRESTELYFRTINPALSIVHQELFRQSVEGLGPDDIPRDAETALLVVCMQLVTQYTDTSNPLLSEGREMLDLPAYIVAKRVLGILRSTSPASILLIQCAILLFFYEFGHGNVTRAYVTIGDAHTMSQVMSLRPGKYRESEKDNQVLPEEEERRSLYWVLFIVDRYNLRNPRPKTAQRLTSVCRLIHVEADLTSLPLRVPNPSEDDLLPTTNIIWDKQSQNFVTTIERHPANVSANVTLGSFQRVSQCAILLTRALQWEMDSYETSYPPSVESFSELETSTRSLIEAMLMQASPQWGDYYECFATCTW